MSLCTEALSKVCTEFSAGIKRKSHFKEFHCDYMNHRRARVTGETAGLDVRKCIKGSQQQNDSSNAVSLPTHVRGPDKYQNFLQRYHQHPHEPLVEQEMR